MAKCAIAVFMLLLADIGTLSAQDCLHGPAEQPAQSVPNGIRTRVLA